MKKLTDAVFLTSAAAAFGAFTIVPRHVLGGQGFTAPSDQITKAVIGVGGMEKKPFGLSGCPTACRL